MAADSKARLEDIYLPFKPKRRTKARSPAKPAWSRSRTGCSADPTQDPTTAAAGYVDAEKGVADTAAALDGARSILVERFAEDADLIGELRERMWTRGRLASKVRDGKETDGAKFADYFDFSEPFTKLPSHRILAMFRGEKEEVLDLDFDPEPAVERRRPHRATSGASRPVRRRGPGRPADKWLADTVRWAWRTRILRLSRHRPARAPVAGRRGRGGARLRREPARPAARRARRHPRHDGPRPGLRTGVRSRSSTRRERSSKRRRSTRTSRSSDGTASFATLAALVARTASSSSP